MDMEKTVTVIVIEGEKDNGKTSTIREVAKIISKHLEGKFIYGINNNDFCSDDEKEPELKKIKEKIEELEKKEEKGKPQDIRLIIQFNNGIKIGIESQGDPDNSKRLEESLKKFKDECNIILCAKRHSKKGKNLHKEIEEMLNNKENNKTNEYKYKIKVIKNIQTQDKDIQTECNEKSAELIYELIVKAIIG